MKTSERFTGEQQQHLNYDSLYARIYKFTSGDESLTWECIARAWQVLDTTRPIAEQAAFMHKAARQYALDYWKDRKRDNGREIPERFFPFNDKGERETPLDVAVSEDEPMSDREYLLLMVKHCPKHLQRAMIIVVNNIFNETFFCRQDPIKEIAGILLSMEESIRQQLKKYNWRGQISQYECARQLYLWLREWCLNIR